MKDDVRINLNAEVMRCRDQAGPTRRSIQGMGGARMQQTANKKALQKDGGTFSPLPWLVFVGQCSLA